MAKGNLFLGTAARSVGDVVMYRREGAQVSRVRVRNVANPKTNAQSIQRNFFAPVAKFFSPLSIVLARSWEGLSKSKSYSAFLKNNITLARQNGWYLPKGTGFFPLPYKLTQGSLPSFTYSIGENNDVFTANMPGATTETTTIGTLSAGLIANGYSAGDVITFILITGTKTKGFIPHAVQFEIDSTNQTLLQTIFNRIPDVSIESASGALNFNIRGSQWAAGAVVIARYSNNVWRRSTQSLVVDTGLMEAVTSAEAIAAAIASYGNSASGVNPMVYLDGDELND